MPTLRVRVRTEREGRALADLDVILMRKDPPFDNEFVYSTYWSRPNATAYWWSTTRRACATATREAVRHPVSSLHATYAGQPQGRHSARVCRNSVTSFSNPWMAWAVPRSSVTAPAIPTSRSSSRPSPPTAPSRSWRRATTKGENIKLIIKRNSLINPVYVGDTEGDLKAARYAGIPFIYARYGFGKVKGYDYIINSFDEILKLV